MIGFRTGCCCATGEENIGDGEGDDGGNDVGNGDDVGNGGGRQSAALLS